MTEKLKIAIAGKNNIAVNALEYVLQQFDCSDIFVIANKNDAGVDSWQKSLLKYAKQTGVQVRTLEDLYSFKNLYFFSLEFDKIIKPRLFASKHLFNIHFSLLPEYKGMYTSALPILHGKDYTGVTLHHIDQGIDTGDIIDQIKLSITPNDCARDLYFKYLTYGYEIFKKNFKNLIKGSYTSTPQPIKNSTYYSKKSIDYNQLTIDLNVSAFQLHNQIRAFCFKEYQYPKVYNYTIISSEILPEKSSTFAGKIVAEGESFITISTIDYNVKLFKA